MIGILIGDMMDMDLPLAAMERILKKGSPDIRVSESANEELRIVLEEYGVKVARTGARFALHAQRKTVKAEDIKLAIKHPE